MSRGDDETHVTNNEHIEHTFHVYYESRPVLGARFSSLALAKRYVQKFKGRSMRVLQLTTYKGDLTSAHVHFIETKDK